MLLLYPWGLCRPLVLDSRELSDEDGPLCEEFLVVVLDVTHVIVLVFGETLDYCRSPEKPGRRSIRSNLSLDEIITSYLSSDVIRSSRIGCE